MVYVLRTMRAIKGFFLTLFVLAVLAGAGFGVLAWRREVDAHSLANIVVAPAPPQPSLPAEDVVVDPRLARLPARADGARLLWAPDDGARLLSAGFSDDDSLVLNASATSGKETHWRLMRFEIASGTPETLFDSSEERLVAGNRSAHQDAGKLCYSKPGAAGPFEVWCSDSSGHDERQLTFHDGREDLLSPTISPDGWVAFEVNSDRLAKMTKRPVAAGTQPNGASSIWKIRLDGTGIQQLTRGGDDRHPSWSDDGKNIFFQRRSAQGWDAYGMEADGTNPAPLLRTSDIDERFPVRRAATDTFLLVESASGAPARLKRLDAVTKAGAYPTADGFGPETSPSISPDGAIAAFLAPVDPRHPDALGVWLIPLEE